MAKVLEFLCSATVLGFLYMLLGAICGGSFGLPSKYVHKDTPWEVLWGPFFFFVTILLPVVLGPVIVKDFFAVYGTAGLAAMAMPLIFGLLWGLGSMTLGMSFAFIGLSLAYSLNYGAQIVTGSMVPMLIHHADQVLTHRGYVVMAGVAVCVLGVIVCGRAAMLKERSLAGGAPGAGDSQGPAGKKPRMAIGVIVGIASGVLCACYSVAFSFADRVDHAAVALGNPPYRAAWAVMSLIVWGGAISSLIYCGVLLTKNRTWGRLATPAAGKVLALALVMAVLHDAAIFLYGLGAFQLGALGGSVGYAVFMSFAIIVGNAHGFRTGEWRGAGKQSISWIAAGIAVLVVGICVLGVANSMG
jgi:L-rhamnose-H+ transport protein